MAPKKKSRPRLTPQAPPLRFTGQSQPRVPWWERVRARQMGLPDPPEIVPAIEPVNNFIEVDNNARNADPIEFYVNEDLEGAIGPEDNLNQMEPAAIGRLNFETALMEAIDVSNTWPDHRMASWCRQIDSRQAAQVINESNAIPQTRLPIISSTGRMVLWYNALSMQAIPPLRFQLLYMYYKLIRRNIKVMEARYNMSVDDMLLAIENCEISYRDMDGILPANNQGNSARSRISMSAVKRISMEPYPTRAVLPTLMRLILRLELPYESDFSLLEYLEYAGAVTNGMILETDATCAFTSISGYTRALFSVYETDHGGERYVLQNGVYRIGGVRKLIYRGSDSILSTVVRENARGVGSNPYLDGGNCFIRAFLHSQCRQWDIENRHVKSITNLSNGISVPLPQDFLSDNPIPVDNPYFEDDSVILFSIPIGYTNDKWESAAIYLHRYVEYLFVGEVDRGSLEGTPQLYSNIFQVCIHLFEVGSQVRKDVYVPCDFKDRDLSVLSELRHIYIYRDNHHIFPIKDILGFFGTESDFKVKALCDMCQRQYKNTFCRTKSHVDQCLEDSSFESKHVHEFLQLFVPTNFYEQYSVTCVPGTKDIVGVYCFEGRHWTDGSCDHDTERRKTSRCYKCNICRVTGPIDIFAHNHTCKMTKPDPIPVIANERLFALDIESKQIPDSSGKLVHRCVLICIKPLYSDEVYRYTTFEEFLTFCMSSELNRFRNGVFIAHNGGGYDYQFLITELEKSGFQYGFIPQANSAHKYLEITIPVLEMRFIDFMALMPGSLKSIGKALQCDVQKGDFPHNFLTYHDEDYVGAFPPLNSDRDYFGIRYKKSEDDVKELEDWHRENSEKYCTCFDMDCTCVKEKWNCRQFLYDYCVLDVRVLAEAAVKYRTLLLNLNGESDYNWQATPVDPFTCLTQSQIAMQIFLSGFINMPEIHISIPKTRRGIHWKQFVWFHRIDTKNSIYHTANQTREYLFKQLKYIPDGVSYLDRTVYEFIDCDTEGCPFCNEDHPQTNRTIERIEEIIHTLEYVGLTWKMRIMRLCEFDNWILETEKPITDYERELANYIKDREFFFGGRTEVFSPYANADMLNCDIKYHDVCSLYPTVCTFRTMPIGKPHIYWGKTCDINRCNKDNENRYFGFIRCKVMANPNDLLGVLPEKLDNRLKFTVTDKIGTWFTEELWLAQQLGYRIVEVYEVHHFDANNRSDTFFKGYMEYFLRMKQEAEGWKKLGASSENPSEEEKSRVCEQVFISNGNISRPRPHMVTKNPVMRHVAKIFLNCLWGKFCQRPGKDSHCFISSLMDYEAIMACDNVDKNEIKMRHTGHGNWKVTYDANIQHKRPNNRYNIYIAACVTANARTYLHKQMCRIRSHRILYCDTDSIIFLYGKDEPELSGTGLGKWTDEYPDKRIREFSAIAPKCYSLQFDDDEYSVKSKGVPMTITNRDKLNPLSFKKLIQAYCQENTEMDTVTVDNFSIFPNTTDTNYSYATVMTRYNSKIVQCVFSKRVLGTILLPDQVIGESVARVYLYPEGHAGEGTIPSDGGPVRGSRPETSSHVLPIRNRPSSVMFFDEDNDDMYDFDDMIVESAPEWDGSCDAPDCI